MILFPLSAAVTVILDGQPIRAYHAAFERAGRTYAPVRPFVTQAADRLWYEGTTLVVQRGRRIIRIPLAPRTPGALDRAYVPLAAVLRALGAHVVYHGREVDVHFAPRAVDTPTPFNPAEPSPAPRAVFTPIPAQTPRPRWSGTPLPRRTPLPVAAPTPH